MKKTKHPETNSCKRPIVDRSCYFRLVAREQITSLQIWTKQETENKSQDSANKSLDTATLIAFGVAETVIRQRANIVTRCVEEYCVASSAIVVDA